MAADIAQRIVRWHPIVLTMVFVVGSLVSVSALGLTLSPLAHGVLMLIPLGPMCIWLWAVFHVARCSSATAISSRWDWVFAIPPLTAFAAGVAGWSTNNSPAAFAIFLSLFIGLSRSAKMLENVDAANGSASVGRMLATALLMYLAPLGVWVLRPKILRAAGRADGTPAVAS